jgi:PAS domain S-box-containing protein
MNSKESGIEPVRILVGGEEPGDGLLMKEAIEKGVAASVEIAEEADSLRNSLKAGSFDAVVLGCRIPGGDGLQMLSEIVSRADRPAVVMVTRYGDQRLASRAYRMGAAAFLLMSDVNQELADAVEDALAVTALSRADIALRHEAALLQHALDTLPEVFAIIDVRGGLVRWNRELGRVTGYANNELESLTAGDLVRLPNGDVGDSDDRWMEAMLEAHLLTRDGRSVPYEFYGSTIFDPDGEVIGRAVVGRDLTDRKRAEERSRRHATELGDLVDIAAHELRHPATVFKGYAAILRERWDDLDEEKRTEALVAIERAADRLAGTVGKLLETSSIESGRSSLDFSVIDGADILRTAVEEARSESVLADVVVFPPAGEARFTADAEKVKDTLKILVDNAVKHSPAGSTVEAGARRSNGGVTFWVADRGPGLPEESRERVFGRFYQVEKVDHHSVPGMGLGLYIARWIVELHGGVITVDDREGGGSIFSFSLPGAGPARGA